MYEIPNIGQRLREARQGRYTQYSLTVKLDELGVDVQPNTIGRWERGENLPPLDAFGALCRLLKLSADTLLGLDQ